MKPASRAVVLVRLELAALALSQLVISRLPTSSLPGTPIVRSYWRDFLERHRGLVRGRGLEIGSTKTLRRYGGEQLISAEAIDLLPNLGVTYVTDLSRAWDLPADRFDVFINQFTLHLIRDDLDALYHSIRVLRPGGTLLCNFPCFSGFRPEGQDFGTGVHSYVWRWYTPPGVQLMLDRLGVGPGFAELETYGSHIGLVAYATGIPAELLPRAWVQRREPHRPLLVCARITKPSVWQPVWEPPGKR